MEYTRYIAKVAQPHAMYIRLNIPCTIYATKHILHNRTDCTTWCAQQNCTANTTNHVHLHHIGRPARMSTHRLHDVSSCPRSALLIAYNIEHTK
eukprot:4624945-Pyramimonas_sp.AAC.1